MTKFFQFRQNNSGGCFDVDDDVNRYVIVEAIDADDANERAEQIGIYFAGVVSGYDCECCGDRWSPVWEEDGTEVPTIYGVPVQESDNRGSIIVHYINGTKETF